MVQPSETVSSQQLAINKIFDVHRATTIFLQKLTNLTLALHPSDDSLTDKQQQLQNLLDNLKQWTTELDSIAQHSQPITPSVRAELSASDPVPNAQAARNGLTGMPATLPSLGLSKKAPSVFVGPDGTPPGPPMMMVHVLRNSLIRSKSSTGPPRSAVGAGTCGIGVVRHKTHMHQRREQQRLVMRRIVPSNAYLSAGSKLYMQQQQQQQQTTMARVPPSNAYLSAGSKLSFRQLTLLQQQRLTKRQQQKLEAPPADGGASTIGDNGATLVAASISTTTGLNDAPITTSNADTIN